MPTLHEIPPELRVKWQHWPLPVGLAQHVERIGEYKFKAVRNVAVMLYFELVKEDELA